MSVIPESHRDLFDLPAVWHVATIGPGGEPHVSPVWAGFDGTHVRFPHAEGRQKWQNLCADDRIAISATDPTDSASSTAAWRSSRVRTFHRARYG